MIEKNVAINYQKEVIRTIVHTLNQVQLKKHSHKIPYELWYGYKPNVSYLKVFGSKFYILKESRKGNFDVKGDEDIFLGYSYRSKAYNFFNLSTHKITKNAHVRIDEFAERTKEESKKEPKDYKRFFYIELDTFPDTSINQETSTPESSSVTKLQEVLTKSQGLKSQSEAIELQLV